MFQPAAQEQLTRRGKRSVSEEGGQTKLITEVSNSQTSSDITARSITLKAGVEGEESPRKDIRAQTGDKTLQLHSMWLLLLSVNWFEETCECTLLLSLKSFLNVLNVTSLALDQIILAHIKPILRIILDCTLVKSLLNVLNVTTLALDQIVWRNIWECTPVKSQICKSWHDKTSLIILFQI